jgi:type II secretion system protein I
MTRKRGFTLVEVLIALAIMSVVLLALGSMTASYLHVVTVGDRNAAALQLVDSRVDQIQMDPQYATLEATYVGVESGFATLAGFTRTTTITHITAGTLDYKKITVTVAGPTLAQPVSRSVTVAAP